MKSVNVDNDSMDMACNFLNCSKGSVPFKYLGLLVGAKAKSMSTWEPLVEKLSGRLNTWGHKYISFGGRIVLLNSVLNVIPIFYLSFLKLPVQVWKRLVRIQREFLWGGVEGSKKISWVKWESVCRHKSNGGLGIKDIRIMNVSLLVKWRWRLLNGNIALWKEVLEARYGAIVGGLLEEGFSGRPSFASEWWKDIVKLGDFGGPNWFNLGMERKVGNGLTSSFWNNVWRGDKCFRVKYPRLFSISTHTEAMVGEVGLVSDRGTVWSLNWRRHLFMWEEKVLVSFMEDLEGVRFSNEADVWKWKMEDNGVFTVSSSYKKLEELVFGEVVWSEGEKGVFDKMWRSPAPSRGKHFSTVSQPR